MLVAVVCRPALFRLARFCAAACALLLAACGSPPPRPSGDAVPAPREAAPPASAGSPAAVSRPGGYYLDDGPGDSPPPDLDAIPDAQPRTEQLHRFANNPYSVFGQDYVPNQKIRSYSKRGLASWYGRRFHGQKTASGERYDMYAMSAAHPTLPIPSYVRVTNVANGRSVVVRINDRGPFHANRIIDLSYTAAHKLGYVQKGSTLVQVESVLPEEIQLAAKGVKAGSKNARAAADGTKAGAKPSDKPAPAVSPALVAVARSASSPAAGLNGDDPLAELIAAEEAQSSPAPLPTVIDLRGIFLQLGVFSSKDNAESFRDHVRRELPWLAETLHIQPREGSFRLHLGPYRVAQEAKRVADRIRQALDVKPLLVQR